MRVSSPRVRVVGKVPALSFAACFPLHQGAEESKIKEKKIQKMYQKMR